MIHISPKMSAKDFVSERQWNKAKLGAHDAIGKKWHSEMLPSHFHKGAPEKYGHAKRSSSYLKRKRIMAAKQKRLPGGGTVQRGGQIDNVYSGDMERSLKRVGVIRAYPSRATVTMSGPRYMTMRVFEGNRADAVTKGWTYGKGKTFSQRAGKQPDKVKEITTTTEQERKILAEAADVVFERHAAGW